MPGGSQRARGRRGAALPDRDRLLRGVRLFLSGVDDSSLRRDVRRTPARVADAWSREILSGYRSDPARILGRGVATAERGMVVIRDIRFVSICVHHLLPFHGTAHVAYLPSGRLVGLSKITRTIDALARRLQLQERLTRQVVEAIESALRPAGVACRMEAEHLCMTIRGARKQGSRVVTTDFAGRFLEKASLRNEFLRLSGSESIPSARRRRRHRAGA